MLGKPASVDMNFNYRNRGHIVDKLLAILYQFVSIYLSQTVGS